MDDVTLARAIHVLAVHVTPEEVGMDGFSSKTPRRREAHRGDREHE
jgi:hypothetical protein